MGEEGEQTWGCEAKTLQLGEELPLINSYSPLDTMWQVSRRFGPLIPTVAVIFLPPFCTGGNEVSIWSQSQLGLSSGLSGSVFFVILTHHLS